MKDNPFNRDRLVNEYDIDYIQINDQKKITGEKAELSLTGKSASVPSIVVAKN